MSKILVFFLAFFLAFAPVPIFGIYAQSKPKHYLDIFNYNYSLYSIGVSANKSKTILGKNGWMFLGDDYNNVFTKSNPSHAVNSDDVKNNELFIKSLSEIANVFNSDFIYLTAPNKHSIYGEHLDSRLDSHDQTYSYYKNNAKPVRSNLTDYLLSIKNKIAPDLYFKTDTHWNSLGALYGYDYLMNTQGLQKYNKLDMPSEFNETEVPSGDLAKLLNIHDFINDKDIDYSKKRSIRISKTNLNTGETTSIYLQENLKSSAIHNPIKISNPEALNKLSILWLRDSFGDAMSPHMHATFSEVTHQHFKVALENSDNLKLLIASLKPDFIILSAVERDSLDFGKYLQE